MLYNQKHFYNFDKNKYITQFVCYHVNTLFHQKLSTMILNEHLNIFESVSQMTEDRELDSIVLNTIKLDELNNKNNKTNDKYKDIYDFIFGTKGSK